MGLIQAAKNCMVADVALIRFGPDLIFAQAAACNAP
jgi:hypothetical protein